jgi:hypothetical protein
MGSNGKWEFLVPVALAAASLLGTGGSGSSTVATATSGERATLADNLVLQPSAIGTHVRHLDHESHSSHSSHRSHRSHSSSR